MSRIADHPVDPLFTDRWSPRSFTGEAVPDAVLRSAFEAARWAPSAMNAQPWRFLIARPGDAHWERYLDLLMPRNRLWAARASALVLILSALKLDRRGETVDNVSHSFDAGAAWAAFAHQALLLGWHTHGIGGFDRAATRERLNIPDDFAIEAIIALGRKGEIEGLDPEFHASEAPNGRRSIHETVFAGTLATPAFAEERDAA
ncbi:nitroreductase [Sphingobium wenxiniae]|uniref:Nitroreductase domain-containing protein n=2 Tax=Sphingobium TaxID=165695 RepID=T0GDS4_9SPHN|nr:MULTISPECIES: nitroreductase family protein [Sphingobium]EQB01906.1 hypothetical protein L485_09740 [Sphingobium baderi LL03]KMS62221.1 NAD(P)H-flavin oxidoreductase [Sphingobium baderi LL03]MBB6191720.1 nitroreductase [Sphingobium wenxiniae]TWH92681.1 nitroreductase family protein [Sphingobium wenxiniae]WRD76446.1 nitroreductase family protein [Sphingobium baderi]